MTSSDVKSSDVKSNDAKPTEEASLPLKADLHIHTCHSPCGSLEMGPKTVTERLSAVGIRIAAITDHNSVRNVSGFMQLGEKRGILVFPGAEVQSSEEIHVTVVFPDMEKAAAWGRFMDANMPKIPLNGEIFGDQPVVDADENIVELYDLLLAVSVDLTFDEICEKAESDGLIYFPSHLFNPSNSIISQLGFIPPGHLFKIAEIAHREHLDRKKEADAALITNSDAHFPEQVGLRYSETSDEKCMALYWEWSAEALREATVQVTESTADAQKKERLRCEIYEALREALLGGRFTPVFSR